ncbi:LysR family transcriptional regulator [Erythrobacter rubeus]|uniref:LysR family transcriptional regulator n=1 Tax=Erythrobacter rubeus TaxID=2760803 RepID=A0ABR8KPN5_9SPHN|nr:LysR family transcriptional regulator [Erythrobacter rubeus]MBD2841250.1 LysR family transcriptional regulator [Erythrobacter rubeus]
MSDWDDYRLILALARAGTLRAAALELGLTHTTVSRRLAVLQDSRGAVFEKRPEGYVPTPLGSALIDVAENMEGLALAGARYQRASDKDLAGVVTLSLPEAIAQYLLLEDLLDFAQSYPEIELRVQTSYRFVDLDRSEADVVVRGAFQPPDHLVGRRLYPNCVAYYANREYLETTPRDQLCWIAPGPEARMPGWLENSPFPEIPIAISIDDITARHRALVKGLGLSRGACFMADPEPGLVRLGDAPPEAQQDIWVLTHPDLRYTPRIRLVMDHVASAMTKKRGLVLGELPQAFAEL